ncbi:MAG: nuclease-related domain-containing protein, partial [Proteobacteria bacterium]|nr:nuclease-related domain-containing protein [Pseudomonadota bacterium]
SLDEEMERVTGKLMEYCLLPLIMIVVAGYELLWWYFHVPYQPWFLLVMAILLGIYSTIRIRPLLRLRRNLQQGRDGERWVGQQLETFHAQGFKVLHDIPGDRWNVDHILIGPKGVFTIETKTISKPGGQAEIHYDGDGVVVNGIAPDRNPIVQAKAGSRWIHNLIEERTGKSFFVRAVVMYTGWYIKYPQGAEVWVLNEKLLPLFLDKEEVRLQPEDVELTYACLSHYVRSSTSELKGQL